MLLVPEWVPKLIHVFCFVSYKCLNPLIVCLSHPVFCEVAAAEARVIQSGGSVGDVLGVNRIRFFRHELCY